MGYSPPSLMSVEVYAFAGCIAHMMNKVDDTDAVYKRGLSYHAHSCVLNTAGCNTRDSWHELF
jgi:hypothetical protein